ncbi:hypothetical protein ILYODFUR_002444 [Ilyodon furcidens]|uniref:Uncharacterized protein n=1 Tax=Ilyodon furcidens TaxID=33524 RepID=A0ABV0SHV3_9TELE
MPGKSVLPEGQWAGNKEIASKAANKSFKFSHIRSRFKGMTCRWMLSLPLSMTVFQHVQASVDPNRLKKGCKYQLTLETSTPTTSSSVLENLKSTITSSIIFHSSY